MSLPSNSDVNDRAISSPRPCFLSIGQDVEPEDSTEVTEVPNLSSPSADIRSSDNTEENDQHTISGYGEISLSTPYFITSPDTDVSPSKRGGGRFTWGPISSPRRFPRLTFSSSENPRKDYIQKHTPVRRRRLYSTMIDVEALCELELAKRRAFQRIVDSRAKSKVKTDGRSEGTSAANVFPMAVEPTPESSSHQQDD